MEYMKLVLGVVILIAFGWILVRNSKRTGFLHALIRVDTVLGLVAGVYLVLTATLSLIA